MFTFEQIYRAYLECRHNKRNTLDALVFECNQEENLIQLVEALNNRSYRPATSVCFYITKPKAREIFAAHFRDRIVHHLIYNEIAPVWEKIFIDQSFACRPEKGTHKAALVLQKYLRKITKSGKKPAYYLKMDIQNFFMSINKPILFQLLCKKCPDEALKWLLEVVIFHDPTTDYKLQSSLRVRQKIPQQKSLFHVLENCGLPIGNLTSQFFANVYLNELDQFVKHTLKCRFYMRYVDDSILLSDNVAQLVSWKNQIIDFIDNKLLLGINQEATKIDSVFNGVDFVGFIVRPFYMLCRRRVIGNCKLRLQTFRERLQFDDSAKTVWKYDRDLLEHLLATVNSYLGHFRHARTRKIILKLFKDFSYLSNYFHLDFDKLIRKYTYPRTICYLRQQVSYYTKVFAGYLVLFQVGCYYEAYGNSAEQLNLILGYQLKKGWRGFPKACGFHKRFWERVCSKIEDARISYVVIEQTGNYLSATMERIPRVKVEFKI